MKLVKSFQELDLSNAFLFAAAMEEPEICRGVLERILETPIRRVAVRTEKSLLLNPETRSVRLDVYADDDANSMYNVEMQTANQGDLPRRSRFHQSRMDVQTLRSGSSFQALKESYVIFICTFDPFGQGKYRYCFEERCLETGTALKDGTHKIFLNSKGENPEEVPGALVQFLKYVVNSTGETANAAEDNLLHSLHDTVTKIKHSGEMEAQYMTLEEWVDDLAFEVKQEARAEGLLEGKLEGKILGKLEGKLEGHLEGEKETLTLVALMLNDGLTDGILKLGTDPDFLEEMKRKYNLQQDESQ